MLQIKKYLYSISIVFNKYLLIKWMELLLSIIFNIFRYKDPKGCFLPYSLYFLNFYTYS